MSQFYLPSQNDGKHIFVFGSNLRGRHGKGAALEAATYWGAQEGCGFGRTGQAYAIPTKGVGYPLPTLRLDVIGSYVEQFIVYARSHHYLTFLITPIGCGLAGLHPRQIAPFFQDVPDNCVMPEQFKKILIDIRVWPRGK